MVQDFVLVRQRSETIAELMGRLTGKINKWKVENEYTEILSTAIAFTFDGTLVEAIVAMVTYKRG